MSFHVMIAFMLPCDNVVFAISAIEIIVIWIYNFNSLEANSAINKWMCENKNETENSKIIMI